MFAAVGVVVILLGEYWNEPAGLLIVLLRTLAALVGAKFEVLVAAWCWGCSGGVKE